MAPSLLPKRKTADENFDVPGLDLGRSDLPTKENQPFQTVLFAPVYCSKDTPRQLKYRLNVAIILRAFDYFYEFRHIDDFWSRVRYVIYKLWKPAHVEEIANRYIEARRRYLNRTNGSPLIEHSINLAIVNLADKLIANQTGAISQVSYPPDLFEGRARRWAVDVRDVEAFLEPFKNPSFLSRGSPVGQKQQISSSPPRPAFSRSPKSEVSDSDDYSKLRDNRPLFGQDVLFTSRQEQTRGPMELDAPSTTDSDLHTKPVPVPRENNALALSQFRVPAKPIVSSQPSTVIPMEHSQQLWAPSTSEPSIGVGSAARQYSILGAANNTTNGGVTNTPGKRSAVSNEVTPDPKRRAVSPVVQTSMGHSHAGSIDKEMSATANDQRPAPSTPTLSTGTAYRPTAASPHISDSVSALTKSSGTYAQILPDGASPMQSPGLASEAEIQRLQSACNEKDQHTEQLQKTIVIMVESMKTAEERAAREHEEVVRLRKEKSDLAARLQAAEEKIAAMDAVGTKTHDNTLGQAGCEQFLSQRDYKGLLGHVANDIPKLAEPLFHALKQEKDNESSAQWQAVEAGWIALDWAKKQLNDNANKL